MKKLQNIIYILLACSTLIFTTRCSEDFLNEDLKSEYAPANVFKDSLGFEAAIAGLQRLVREKYNGPQGLIATLQVGTDVCINGGNNVEGSQIPYEQYDQMNSQDAAASSFWTWGYRAINAANLIIEGSQSEEANLSDYARKLYEAEGRFFRAYVYNFLSILYGDVPLVTKPVKTPKTDFVREPVSSIVSTIISDLTFAMQNLPDITKVNNSGRVNKWAAEQLLAEAYIRNNQPELAETHCLNIIKSTRFSLVTERYGVKADEPGDPYSDMFIYGNQRYPQGNTEAIWVIELANNVPGGDDGQSQFRRVWVPQYWNVGGMVICDSLGGRGLGRMRSSPWWAYEIYEDSDMRNSPYNIRRHYYRNDSSDPLYGTEITVTGADTLNKMFPHNTKWYYFDPLDVFGYVTKKDRIIMRLSETYLLLAEAQFMQGHTSDAAISLNVVRNRANATPVAAADVSLDYILDERARELIGEEDRRVTLVRTGTLIDRVKAHNPVSASTIKDYNMLMPIPQAQIDLNKDAVLSQNDEY
jgi:starch-binding outer membrane protein, SusD/RagB family